MNDEFRDRRERWQCIERIVREALERDSRGRTALLDRACADDVALRKEVESLLACAAAAGEFLETPALDIAADLLRPPGSHLERRRLRAGAIGASSAGHVPGRASDELTTELPVSFIGKQFGAFRIGAPIGAGGMGVVFRAFDTRLNRTVAVKVLADESAAGPRTGRLHSLREARAASALTHPNIVTIHEVGAAAGIEFIVMEFVPGQSLEQRVQHGGLPIDEVLTCAEQIASALKAAHAVGIVHRDLKPANVMVSASNQVKVLDFGIAKRLLLTVLPGTAARSVADATGSGMVVGSPAYMSPEQAQGKTVDGRSDVFSFGVVLYEMLTGHQPFFGMTPRETLAQIVEARPAALRTLRPDVPAALDLLVLACLESDRNRRPSADDVHRRLAAIQLARISASGGLRAMLRRPAVVIPALVAAALAASAGIWWASGREVRAAGERVPELFQFADRFDFDSFYRAARDVVPVLPDDPRLKQLWLNMTMPAAIDSDPPGADVFVKGFLATSAAWIPIGRTPIQQVQVPHGLVRLKASKAGYAPFEGTLNDFTVKYTLDPTASVPEGMVHVSANVSDLEGITFSLPDYWMDRFEVTNRQFKTFVDAGGYRTPDYWKDQFIENGRPVSWNEAMARFLDKTGRPGPSVWELGTYLEGQADFPVGGVSWYEAIAYATFVGKSLPTAFQWRGAAIFDGYSSNFADILTLSNFGTKGPAAAGSHAGIGPYGTYDMAGNVKEWCWNESSGGRLILGGAWNEPGYMFHDRDAQPALDRLPTYGFRLVQNLAPQPAASYGFIQRTLRNYAHERPMSDSAFTIVRRMYGYDPGPLNVRTERSEDAPDWRRETVTFDAGYNGERVIAYVYLPKWASPPYQTVVYFPGGDATLLQSSRNLRLTEVDFVVRSGRALVYPVYKGTYERRGDVAVGTNAMRDVTIARGKDFRRVLDFIETRPDLDRERIAFYGLSLGAFDGVIFTAIEPRVKASVLLGGGLPTRALPIEIDPLSFAPRVQIPTLMVNGRSDFTYPEESSQLPLFRLLGAPAEHKRRIQVDGGHLPVQMNEVIREILEWFDNYLGPVNATPRG